MSVAPSGAIFLDRVYSMRFSRQLGLLDELYLHPPLLAIPQAMAVLLLLSHFSSTYARALAAAPKLGRKRCRKQISSGQVLRDVIRDAYHFGDF